MLIRFTRRLLSVCQSPGFLINKGETKEKGRGIYIPFLRGNAVINHWDRDKGRFKRSSTAFPTFPTISSMWFLLIFLAGKFLH